jgi:hypothetical protein
MASDGQNPIHTYIYIYIYVCLKTEIHLNMVYPIYLPPHNFHHKNQLTLFTVKDKIKVHPFTGTEALYRSYGL